MGHRPVGAEPLPEADKERVKDILRYAHYLRATGNDAAANELRLRTFGAMPQAYADFAGDPSFSLALAGVVVLYGGDAHEGVGAAGGGGSTATQPTAPEDFASTPGVIVKKPPNPWGRRGSPAHQAKVADVEESITSRGLAARTEEYLPDAKRYADVAGINAEGKVVEVHQVGVETKRGIPVARERRAFDDIANAYPDVELYWHAYR